MTLNTGLIVNGRYQIATLPSKDGAQAASLHMGRASCPRSSWRLL